MRYLLHLGLFVLALTAVSQADAQERRRAGREVTVVVSRGGHHAEPLPERRPVYESPHAIYDQRRNFYEKRHIVHDRRRELHDELRDLEEIVHISRSWKRATVMRNRRAQAISDRRLEVWLERELRESRRGAHGDRHAHRLYSLSRQLDALHWKFATGRAHRPHYAKKARILDELVAMSERQVRRAEARVHGPYRFSYASY